MLSHLDDSPRHPLDGQDIWKDAFGGPRREQNSGIEDASSGCRLDVEQVQFGMTLVHRRHLGDE